MVRSEAYASILDVWSAASPSSWSFTGTIVAVMDWLRRKSATAFSVVVPGATPMRLPARSATVLRPDPSAISRLAPSTNVMSVKSTFSCRDREAVVEPRLDVDRAVDHRVHAVLGSDGHPAHGQSSGA
jgi:hypothetical protein